MVQYEEEAVPPVGLANSLFSRAEAETGFSMHDGAQKHLHTPPGDPASVDRKRIKTRTKSSVHSITTDNEVLSGPRELGPVTPSVLSVTETVHLCGFVHHSSIVPRCEVSTGPEPLDHEYPPLTWSRM